MLLLQATRWQPVGVWVRGQRFPQAFQVHWIVSVLQWDMGRAFFCGSSFVFVSSLLEATDEEEGGEKIKYHEPREKDCSSFLRTGLDKRSIHPVAATED